jgi:heterodisulfide reductase subunit A
MAVNNSVCGRPNEAGRRIGVYFVRAAEDGAANGTGAIDLERVAAYALKLPGVVIVRTVEAAAVMNPESLARELGRDKLSEVVLASLHPGFFKSAFAHALALAGGKGENVRLASFGERGDGDSTDRAQQVVASAVSGAPFSVDIASSSASSKTATLVIGGGIAGIQASLEIAASGNKVYLVERTGTIGGRMAMFDKTFPTLDCAACILTPKMVNVGQNPNIELLVFSEVQQVTGNAGDFKVKVMKHTTRVDASSCVACGDCVPSCPVTVSSEFDQGIATRKNIYIPFPQAVPNVYAIDAEHCLWVQSDGKKCGICAKKCAKNAIHLDAKDEVVELEVGNIIVTTGYDTLDARRLENYGYGTYPNVLTSLEFERLSNASGPTGGKIVLKTKRLNKKTKTDEWVFEPEGALPKSVAIIHCVGSRDHNHNSYCSRVCCMYSLKFAHLVREKAPDAECFEYYIDMRAFGKGYEEFSERIREEGVSLLRGRPAEVTERDSQLTIRGEDVITGKVVDRPVDMVILSVGLLPAAGAADLAMKLGIRQDADGWFRELNYNSEPNSTGRNGIFIAGVCQGPKDIPDTVAQASAAAASVLRSIVGRDSQDSVAGQPLQAIEGKPEVPARV